MAYPVDDQSGINEGINYLLSGPSGLGQNFQGFASYTPAYLTSYFRAPFSVPTTTTPVPLWYSTPIAIGNITPIDTLTFEVTFAVAQATPPFTIEQGLLITGTTSSGADPAFYDAYWTPPGVIECSTTSVIIRTNTPIIWPSYISGGTIGLDASDGYVSTDCNARVTVYGPQDRVFISCQITLDWTYDCLTSTNQVLRVAINRYAGFLDTSDPNNPDYLFADRTTISEQSKSYPVTTGTGTITDQQFIFSTVIDQPSYISNGAIKGYGYYWYICELFFENPSSNVYPVEVATKLRSFTAQVIKQ